VWERKEVSEISSKNHLIVVQDGRNRCRRERLGREGRRVVEVGEKEGFLRWWQRQKSRGAREAAELEHHPQGKLKHWASNQDPRMN
jgi:hypothetical protein